MYTGTAQPSFLRLSPLILRLKGDLHKSLAVYDLGIACETCGACAPLGI